MLGEDRKICPEDHHLASQGLSSDVITNSDPAQQTFYLPLTQKIDFFLARLSILRQTEISSQKFLFLNSRFKCSLELMFILLVLPTQNKCCLVLSEYIEMQHYILTSLQHKMTSF